MTTVSVACLIGKCFCRIYNLFKWQLLLSTINFSSNILILSAQQNNISQKVEFSKKKTFKNICKEWRWKQGFRERRDEEWRTQEEKMEIIERIYRTKYISVVLEPAAWHYAVFIIFKESNWTLKYILLSKISIFIVFLISSLHYQYLLKVWFTT